MPRLLILLMVAFTIMSAAAFAACEDDSDEPATNETSIAEPDPEADPDPEPDPEADPEAAPIRIVEPKPDGATQVDVALSEWAIEASPAAVPAGQIYFLVENQGPDDAHEFVVVRSDSAPDALPVEEGRVPEEEVDLLDEIERFATNSKASLTLDLEPGAYVLLCNIAEEEEGEIESHYELGMRTAFTVQ